MVEGAYPPTIPVVPCIFGGQALQKEYNVQCKKNLYLIPYIHSMQKGIYAIGEPHFISPIPNNVYCIPIQPLNVLKIKYNINTYIRLFNKGN